MMTILVSNFHIVIYVTEKQHTTMSVFFPILTALVFTYKCWETRHPQSFVPPVLCIHPYQFSSLTATFRPDLTDLFCHSGGGEFGCRSWKGERIQFSPFHYITAAPADWQGHPLVLYSNHTPLTQFVMTTPQTCSLNSLVNIACPSCFWAWSFQRWINVFMTGSPAVLLEDYNILYDVQ